MPQWANDLAALEVVFGVIVFVLGVALVAGAYIYWRWWVWHNARLLKKELAQYVGKRFRRNTPQEWWTREIEVTKIDDEHVRLEVPLYEQARVKKCAVDNNSPETWLGATMGTKQFLQEWCEVPSWWRHCKLFRRRDEP